MGYQLSFKSHLNRVSKAGQTLLKHTLNESEARSERVSYALNIRLQCVLNALHPRFKCVNTRSKRVRQDAFDSVFFPITFFFQSRFELTSRRVNNK